MMNCSIPVYNADGSLYSCVSEQRLARLQSAGLVSRVVRHRKGCINNRAILFMRPGEPKPLLARSVMGTTYRVATTIVAPPLIKLAYRKLLQTGQAEEPEEAFRIG
jgi:hypothetical protein